MGASGPILAGDLRASTQAPSSAIRVLRATTRQNVVFLRRFLLLVFLSRFTLWICFGFWALAIGFIRLKDPGAGGHREESPRPPRTPEASRTKSVRRRGEAKRSHRPSPLRRPAFCGRGHYLGGGGKKGRGKEEEATSAPPPSSPLRLDRGPGRKRRDGSAAVAGAFSWPRRRTGPPLCGWLQGLRGGRGDYVGKEIGDFIALRPLSLPALCWRRYPSVG